MINYQIENKGTVIHNILRIDRYHNCKLENTCVIS